MRLGFMLSQAQRRAGDTLVLVVKPVIGTSPKTQITLAVKAG
jgi:hypothetical protein